jgi:hypothetical protein
MSSRNEETLLDESFESPHRKSYFSTKDQSTWHACHSEVKCAICYQPLNDEAIMPLSDLRSPQVSLPISRPLGHRLDSTQRVDLQTRISSNARVTWCSG